jgi:hypothetical protein
MKSSFFAELKRRNVYKVAVAYAVVAWLLMYNDTCFQKLCEEKPK